MNRIFRDDYGSDNSDHGKAKGSNFGGYEPMSICLIVSVDSLRDRAD